MAKQAACAFVALAVLCLLGAIDADPSGGGQMGIAVEERSASEDSASQGVHGSLMRARGLFEAIKAREGQELSPEEHRATQGMRSDLLATLLQVSEGVRTDPEPTSKWRMGETSDGFFGFEAEGKTRMFISAEGDVWDYTEKGYLAAESPHPLDNGKLSEGVYQMNGAWAVGETLSGGWGAYKNDVLKFLIQEDGNVWSAFEQGYLKGKAEMSTTKVAAIPAHFALVDGTAVVSGEWKMGETPGGHLAWYKGEELKALLHDEGDLYGAAIEGYFEKKEESEVSSGGISQAMSTTVVDCAIGEWTAYDECDKKCGGGRQKRLRTVVTAPQNGGAACPHGEESRKCNTFGCAVDCSVSEWSEWSICDQKCGGGEHSRVREVTAYPSSHGQPCPILSQARHCNLQQCGAPLCSTLSASFNRMSAKSDDVYFFAKQDHGEVTPKWVRWNLLTRSIEAGPFAMQEHDWFRDLPEPFASKGIDGALNRATASETVYLFTATTEDTGHTKNWEGEWVEWDMGTDSVLSGPHKTLAHPSFIALPAPFNAHVNAAVNLKDNSDKSYLFSNVKDEQGRDDYTTGILWDFANASAVGEGFRLSEWDQLPPSFTKRIDAAVNRRGFSDEILLFSGTEWLRFDMGTRSVIDGPFQLADHPDFKPLVEALELCTGSDLRQIGQDSLYVNQLSALDPTPVGTITRVVGQAGEAGYADTTVTPNTAATTTASKLGVMFDSPSGVSIVGQDQTTTAYVVDTRNHAIRRVLISTGDTTTVAGGASPNAGFMDGVGATARFHSPTGVSALRIDDGGMKGDIVYVADRGNHAIRRIFVAFDATEGEVLTVAGGGATQCEECHAQNQTLGCDGCCECNTHGFADGQGQDARFYEPHAISILFNHTAVGITANEFVYVADTSNHAIRRIIVPPGVEPDNADGTVVTVAGGQRDHMNLLASGETRGLSGFADGEGAAAMFKSPMSVAALRVVNPDYGVPSFDTVYVADKENNALRRIIQPLLNEYALQDGDAALLKGNAAHVAATKANAATDAARIESAEPAMRRLLMSEAKQVAHALGEGMSFMPAGLGAMVNRQQQTAAAALHNNAQEASLMESGAPGGALPGVLMESEDPPPEEDQTPMNLPTKQVRWTMEGGTAPKDSRCHLPFEFYGIAYNDCTDLEDGAQGITSDKFSAEGGWCPTTGDGNAVWGPCAPKGYQPAVCKVGPWQAYAPCSKACGGGEMVRNRDIVVPGDAGTGCPVLNETRACNEHTCGVTMTVTGGMGPDGTPMGYGVVDSENTPDIHHQPHSLVALHRTGVDIVYSLGSEEAGYMVKRVDVHQDDIRVGFAARLAGGVGLGVATESSLYGVTIGHNLKHVDLSLQVECQPWMSNALNHWDSDPEKRGHVVQSRALSLQLKPSVGSHAGWTFKASRSIQAIEYDDFIQFGVKQWKGDLVKNMLCLKEDAAPAVGVFPSESCCVTKLSPLIKKPCDGEYEECSIAHKSMLQNWEAVKVDVERKLKTL